MRISEIFESIQGEGKYVGTPSLFIRLQGCNLRCPFCDSKYTWNPNDGKEISVDEVKEIIKKSDKEFVVFTGGEPMLQIDEVYEIIKSKDKFYSIETNGTILDKRITKFDYIAFSPKDKVTAKRVYEFTKKYHLIFFDIKVVTDLETVGVDMIKYATMLMPLTTFNKEKDLKIKRKLWQFCMEHNIKYNPRIQIDVWDKRRGV